MKLFFVKEIMSNAFLVGGQPVAFVPLQDNRGVLELDDQIKEQAALAAVLAVAAREQRGGIVSVTAEQAELVKKNSRPLIPSEHQSKPKELLQVIPDPRAARATVTAPAAAQPANLSELFNQARAVADERKAQETVTASSASEVPVKPPQFHPALRNATELTELEQLDGH